MKNNNIFKSSFVLFAHFITKSIHFSVVARLTIGRDLNEFIKMKHTSQVLKELTDFIFVAFQTQIREPLTLKPMDLVLVVVQYTQYVIVLFEKGFYY